MPLKGFYPFSLQRGGNLNPGIEAVCELASMGYRFTLNGEKIKAIYHGPGEPDPSQVRPLLEAVRAHKGEVLRRLAQKLPVPSPDHAMTCFKCGHFSPGQSPNPTQAWGQCHKWGKGRFGCAMACEAVMEGISPQAKEEHLGGC
jgi:hypothetical protein